MVYSSNGWLLHCALLGPGSIPRSQIKLVVVGWITTPGLEITEEKLPLLFHQWQWQASICKRTTHNITAVSGSDPPPPPPPASVCLKAYSQTMLQAVKKLLHTVCYITLRSPFVFCIYVCSCLTHHQIFCYTVNFL